MRTTPFYRAVMLDIERRRIELGITMLDMDELAGTQSGYYGKCQAVDSHSGRQARWETIDLFVQVLFPRGVDVRLAPGREGELSAASYRDKIVFAAAASGRKNVRSLMLDLAKKGGHKRADILTPDRRRAIARKAGKASAKARRLKRRMDAEGAVQEE
jgi:hypothetical protein